MKCLDACIETFIYWCRFLSVNVFDLSVRSIVPENTFIGKRDWKRRQIGYMLKEYVEPLKQNWELRFLYFVFPFISVSLFYNIHVYDIITLSQTNWRTSTLVVQPS